MKAQGGKPPPAPTGSLEALLKRDLEAWLLAKAVIEAARRASTR